MGRVRIEPGAVLLWALAYFFDSRGIVAAILPPVVFHELGHVLALRLCRCSPRLLRVGLFGAELDYAGSPERRERFLCAAAGPLAGSLWALGASRLGGEYFRLSASLSAALTVFNLLPILPLDGARMLEALAGEKITEYVSLFVSVAACAGGLVLLWQRGTAAAFIMALWLLSKQRNAA